jgi:flagellar motor switch/type III secretory pathway protein FliN
MGRDTGSGTEPGHQRGGMTESGELIEIPLFLSGADETPVLFANHFLIQEYQGEFILSVGQLVPPPLVGTDEERREQARQLSSVSVKVVARLAFTRRRLAEFISLMQGTLARYDERANQELHDA